MRFISLIQILIASASIILGPTAAFAHNGIEHVLGTVRTVSANSITVETVRHTVTMIALDPATTYTNKGVKSALKDLKVADRVAIDTRDDAADKPHAISVKWGTAKTPAPKAPSRTERKINP